MTQRGNRDPFTIDQDDLSEYIQSKLKLDVDTVDAVLDAEMAYLEARGLAGEEGAMLNEVSVDSSVDMDQLTKYIAEKSGIATGVVTRILEVEADYFEK